MIGCVQYDGREWSGMSTGPHTRRRPPDDSAANGGALGNHQRRGTGIALRPLAASPRRQLVGPDPPQRSVYACKCGHWGLRMRYACQPCPGELFGPSSPTAERRRPRADLCVTPVGSLQRRSAFERTFSIVVQLLRSRL